MGVFVGWRISKPVLYYNMEATDSSPQTQGRVGRGFRRENSSRPLFGMERWPRHYWTSIFTYGVIFVMFPVFCWVAYAWVQGWLF